MSPETSVEVAQQLRNWIAEIDALIDARIWTWPDVDCIAGAKGVMAPARMAYERATGCWSGYPNALFQISVTHPGPVSLVQESLARCADNLESPRRRLLAGCLSQLRTRVQLLAELVCPMGEPDGSRIVDEPDDRLQAECEALKETPEPAQPLVADTSSEKQAAASVRKCGTTKKKLGSPDSPVLQDLIELWKEQCRAGNKPRKVAPFVEKYLRSRGIASRKSINSTRSSFYKYRHLWDPNHFD